MLNKSNKMINCYLKLKFTRALLLLVLLFVSSYLNGQKYIASNNSRIQNNNYTLTPNLPKDYSYLMDQYDINFYFIDIEANSTSTAIKGRTEIQAMVLSNKLETFAIELHPEIAIDSILINKKAHKFIRNASTILVKLNSPLLKQFHFSAEIFYNRSASLKIPGVYHFKNDRVESLATCSEPLFAQNWFACKQVLTDKADSVYIFITTPKNLKAGSNGVLTNIRPMTNDMVRYEWKTKYPIAYYLISVAIANYKEYTIYAKPINLKNDSIRIQNFYIANDTNNQEFKKAFDFAASALELFSDKYSLYPFWKEKYGHCVAYGFDFGAMEHQTMSTTSSPLNWVMAHELGHQWFGNCVTCATWQDIWINEGFASYSEYIAYQNILDEESASELLKEARHWALSAPTGSIYIPKENMRDEDRVFDWALTYRKGLYLVHMIRNELNNDNLFFEILRGFISLKAFSNATGEDFKNYLNENTPINFDAFFNEWYYGEGYPIYKIAWFQSENKIGFIINQSATTDKTPLFTNTIPIVIKSDKKEIIARVKPSKKTDTLFISNPLKRPIISIELDPNKWLLYGEKSSINKL